MEGVIVNSRIELNYWLECKEAFVLQRWTRNISDQDLFPIMIVLHLDKFIHQEIKYYIIEYDHSFVSLQDQSEEEMIKYIEEIGFVHICYSKDDLPIFIYPNKII